MATKSRVFYRLCKRQDLNYIIGTVTTEVNEFIAELPIGDVLDIKYDLISITLKLEPQLAFMATVIYIE